MTYGFIGCGNMGAALVRAASKKVDGKNIYICDHHEDKLKALSDECGAQIVCSEEAVNSSDFLFIGVKPKVMKKTFDEIKDCLKNRSRTVIVSMAAGIPVESTENMSGCPVIRIMPNIPASVAKGVILYCAGKGVTDEEKLQFASLLEHAGIVDEIPENLIDAASALSGCGPAFVDIFMEALADGAVECGLPRDKALLYAAATVEGSAKMLIDTGKHPGQLKDAVCSPGGTTIAGVHSLETSGFRGSVMDAVVSSYKKTIGK